MNNENQITTESYDGYIVTLNTLARFFSDTRTDLVNYCDDIAKKCEDKNNKEYNSHRRSYVTFGDFDRITFNEITRFSRYYDLDVKSKYWLGKHQNVFLYRIKCDGLYPQLYPYNYENSDRNEYDYGFGIRKSDTDSFKQSAYTQRLEEGSEFFPFFVLTQVSFSNEVVTRVSNYAEFLKKTKIQLSRVLHYVIRRNNYNVYFEIYGCMNTSEISIVWLCEQYGEVLSLIDYLKDYSFRPHKDEKSNDNLFFSFYSIIGTTLINDNTPRNVDTKEELEAFKNSIKERIKGKASINITVGDKYSAQGVGKKISEAFDNCGVQIEKIDILGGEYDLKLLINVRDIYFQFNELFTDTEDNGIFRNKDIREQILGIKTDLLTDIVELKGVAEDISVEEEDLVGSINDFTKEKESLSETITNKIVNINECLDISDEERVTQFDRLYDELSSDNDNKIVLEEGKIPSIDDTDNLTLRNLYRLIRHCFKVKIDSHTGSIDTLDMLYTDYLSNIHETYNALWRNDYHYQFKKSLIYLHYLLNEHISEEQLKEEFWDRFTETIDYIRQQTVHFSQSGRLVMQIPATHLRYTASADRLFHSYYGMVKAILEEAYGKQRKHEDMHIYQSELLPIITTNSTPKIKSQLYEAGKESCDLRILKIDLPYSLLFDPITGFPHMVHELFHYLAPSDRKLRNEAILEIAVNEALTMIYCAKFESGIKEYLYNLYIENPRILYDLGFPENSSYDSLNDVNYNRDFEKFMSNAQSGATDERLRCLKISISHALWEIKGIKDICKGIVKKIIANGAPAMTTWNESLEYFRECIRSISLEDKRKISSLLVQEMKEYEPVLNGLNKTKMYQGMATNRFIRTCDVLDDKINELIYEHKFRLLNPYNIHSTKELLSNTVEDIFLKGVREATPDLALVKYCNLNDIEYLVTYARFAHDNGLNIIAEYDVVRLMLVLSWMSGSQFEQKGFSQDGLPTNDPVDSSYTGEKFVSCKKFSFQNYGIEFVKLYVSEYMPHKLADNEKKIAELLCTALRWYYDFCCAADKFAREYAIYFKQIESLNNLYDIYFEDNAYIKRIEQLVSIIKQHRKSKLELRSSLISEKQWDIIDEYITNINDHEIKKDTLPTIDILYEKLKNEKFIEVLDYKKISDQHDHNTFWRILDFVHLSSAQKTFKQLGEDVIKSKIYSEAEGSTNAENTNGDDQNSQDNDALNKQIENHTVYDAWDMGGFSSRLHRDLQYLKKGIDEQSSVWFLLAKPDKEIIPTALVSKDQSAEDRVIFERIQRSLQHYLARNEGKLSNLKDYEAVARMTVDSPDMLSNLISWKGDLFSAMQSFYDPAIADSMEQEADLLIFSPEKYLRARNLVADFESKRDVTIPYAYTSTSIKFLFDNTTISKELEYYLFTQSKIDEDEMKYTLNDVNLSRYFPQPVIFANLENNSRFVAYNMRTRVASEDNVETIKKLEVSNLQRTILKEIKTDICTAGSFSQIMGDYAFLYRIHIKKEIFDEFIELTKGKNVSQTGR